MTNIFSAATHYCTLLSTHVANFVIVYPNGDLIDTYTSQLTQLISGSMIFLSLIILFDFLIAFSLHDMIS